MIATFITIFVRFNLVYTYVYRVYPNPIYMQNNISLMYLSIKVEELRESRKKIMKKRLRCKGRQKNEKN